MLGNCGSEVAQLGLKYVHNDTCYPALLVIGQFLDALNSGKYDLDHTALLITQTGGGCRASNYIHLLRKALVKAGYRPDPRCQPELLRPGERQRLPDDPAAGPPRVWPAFSTATCSVPCATRLAPTRTTRVTLTPMIEQWVERSGPRSAGGKGFPARDMKHTFPHDCRRFRRHPRDPRAQGQGGRGGRDLRQVLAPGQQRPGEVPGEPGLRGEPARPDGLCAVLHLQLSARIMSFTAASWRQDGHGSSCSTGWTVSSVPCSTPLREHGFYAPGPFQELVKSPTASSRWGPRWARAGC